MFFCNISYLPAPFTQTCDPRKKTSELIVASVFWIVLLAVRLIVFCLKLKWQGDEYGFSPVIDCPIL